MRNVITRIALAASLTIGLQVSANAAAVDLGVISGTETIKAVTVPGSFNDLYTFSTWDISMGGFAAQSIIFQTTYGVTVTEAALFEGAFTDLSQLAFLTAISAPTTMTSVNGEYASVITLATFANIEANTIYTFHIGGTSIGTAGYTGIIALTDLPTELPPVPEPETYAMLLAGLGMMGMIARRRQKNR